MMTVVWHAGALHTVSLTPGGAVLVFGDNTHGQRGTSPSTSHNTGQSAFPVTSGATHVAAGAFHTLAVLDHSRIVAWGLNTYGQCGTGLGRPVATVPSPQVVSGLPDQYRVRAIVAGEGFSGALIAEGAGTSLATR